MEKVGNSNYKLACESSPNKQQIDLWLNEGRANSWISNQLKEMGDYISVNSIAKYKKMREQKIQEELEEHPAFQAKQRQVTEILNDKVGEIQVVDLMGRLSGLIEDSAAMLQDAKDRHIQINSVKDMRMIQQTMLDAINTYGETMLNAQKFQEINKDPSLLKGGNTTINIEVKQVLGDMLKSAMEKGGDGYDIIDKLRSGTTIKLTDGE